MPNIELFNKDDYNNEYSSKLEAFRKEYLDTMLEISKYRDFMSTGSFSELSLGEVSTRMGTDAAEYAVYGKVVGGAPGAIVGGFVGWVKSLFSQGFSERNRYEQFESNRVLSLNQYNSMLRKSASIYKTTVQKLTTAGSRFGLIIDSTEEKKRLRTTQAMKAKAALAQAKRTDRLNFEKELTNLNRREKLNSVRKINTIQNIKNTKNLFMVTKDATYEKYKLEKSSIDTQLNVLTSKYYMADMTKNLQSIAIAKHKQDRFIQGIVPSIQGLSSTLKDVSASLVSLKQISDNLAVSNAIEQSEQKMLIQYKQTMDDLKGKEEILANRRGSLAQSYRVDIRQISARAAKTLGELNAQKLVYQTELEGIAMQRQVLYATQEERLNSYDSRFALIDKELESTLSLIDYETADNLNREADRYSSLLEETRRFFIETQSVAKRIYENRGLQELQAAGQRFDQIFRDISTTIGTFAKFNPQISVDKKGGNTPTLKSGKI